MVDTSIWWRRMSLEKQLSSVRFLAGIRAPMLVCCLCLLVVGGLAVLNFRGHGGGSVPTAVVQSQRQFVDRLARELHTTLARAGDDLAITARAYGTDPARVAAPGKARDSLLASLVTDHGTWQAAALATGKPRRLVAHRGRPIDLKRIPDTFTATAIVPVLADPDPSLLVAVAGPDDQLLVAAMPVRIRLLSRNAEVGQSVFIATGQGEHVPVQPTAVHTADRKTIELVDWAVATATRHVADNATGDTGSTAASLWKAGSKAGGSVVMASHLAAGTHVPSAQAAGGDNRPTAAVVTAAAVGEAGFAVVSVVQTATVIPATAWRGLPVAFGLLLVAVLVLLLLETTVATPVTRLLEKAKGISTGDLDVRVGRIRGAEARRIDRALDFAAAAFVTHMHPSAAHDHETRPTRRQGRRRAEDASDRARPAGGVRAATMVVIASTLIAGWTGVVAVRYTFVAAQVPPQVVADTENLTDGVADAIRDCFAEGLAQLKAEVRKSGTVQPARQKSTVVGLIDRNPYFRSAYVTDATGHLLVKAGHGPLRSDGHRPQVNRVYLDEHPGARTPVLYTAVALGGGRFLVAEFNVHHLIGLMKQGRTRIRVVDARRRVILDTEGYIAFKGMSGSPLRKAADRADRGERVADVTTVGGIRTLVAATLVSTAGTPAPAGFTLVSQRPTSTFALPENELRDAAWLVSCLSLGIAIMLRLWYGLMFLGPLRALASAADKLAGGDVHNVITAWRHDEIGSIAICLDLCRQVSVDGPARFGGTSRHTPSTYRG